MNGPDWERIEAEFVTGNVSYRELAKQYGLSSATLGRYALKHDWMGKRTQYRETVHEQTVSIFPELAQRKAEENAEHLRKLYTSTDKMVKAIEKVFEDTDQFYRHIVEVKRGDTFDAECRVMEKVDTQAIKHLTGALKDLVSVIRAIYDLPTAQERHNMELATKRLQLEIDKAKREAEERDSDKGGVVITMGGKAKEYSV